MTPAESQSRDITLGKISAPFGVRGWTKVTSFTTPPERLLDYKKWRLVQRGGEKSLTVLQGRIHGKFLVVLFEGLSDRDDVAKLTNATVVVTREDLPPVDEGDYYWADLIGLEVQTTNGIKLGKISSLMETGANDVLVISGDRERLVPWVMDDVVVSVDLDSRFLVVDWDPDF
ncbi:16S rRNA processing protein RimM [Chromatiales bacterium (ex Bugula neritina AB1)]|nr:16S rRNA processing protein RimM [Chromatiales bacterium (ex Bugula neritina AB1)]